MCFLSTLFPALLLLNASQCLLESEFTLSTTTIDRTTTKEVVKGNLYLATEPTILFEVSSPVNQLMWIKRDTVDIYYPDERKLFRILSKDPLPGQNTAVSRIFNLDLERQLHLAGFKVQKARRSTDTIFFYWQPKDDNRGIPKSTEIVTGHLGEDIVLYRAQAKSYKIEFQLMGYKPLNGKRYPSHLRSVVKKGKTSRIEDLYLSNVKTNTALPRHLADFKIPEDASVKIVEW